MTPRIVLTDIEGTTSSIAFVHDVLFPYSRARLAGFVEANPGATGGVLDQVRAVVGDPALTARQCIDRLLAWQADDAKIGPLKTLQGLIWAEGYARGELVGHVYTDAAAGLRRWYAAGLALYVYSSGSIMAQRQLFGHTAYGDLTPLFAGHFDTAIGGKTEPASYAAIADAIGVEPGAILFLSDTPAELAAARSVGLAVMQLARDGGAGHAGFPVAANFDAVLPTEDLPCAISR